MSESLLLKITSENGNINIVSRKDSNVSVKKILVKLILGSSWWINTPAIETLFNLIENMIKNAIKDVYNYNDLIIDYDYRANDTLEDAPLIELFINSIVVDGIEIEVTGRYISFEGEDRRGFWKKLTSFRRKTLENVHKSL